MQYDFTRERDLLDWPLVWVGSERELNSDSKSAVLSVVLKVFRAPEGALYKGC